MKGGWCTGREFKWFPPWAVLFIMISFEGGYSPTKMFFALFLTANAFMLHLTWLFVHRVCFFPLLCCSLGLNGSVINVIIGLLFFCLSYISKTHPHGSSKPAHKLWCQTCPKVLSQIFYSPCPPVLQCFYFYADQVFMGVTTSGNRRAGASVSFLSVLYSQLEFTSECR